MSTSLAQFMSQRDTDRRWVISFLQKISVYFLLRSFLHIKNRLIAYDYTPGVYNYIRQPNNAKAVSSPLFQ